jgi:uncharacterized protein (DUF427 family)
MEFAAVNAAPHSDQKDDMKATIHGKVIATADASQLIMIEGNRYFPPSSIDWSTLEGSPTEYTCQWKGQAEYYSVIGDPKDVAWAYEAPSANAVMRVGEDFTKYVAFDRSVIINE